MKEVDLSELAVGSTTQMEYFGRDGELLVSKGVPITERHLDALRRRNIFEVYIKESGEDELHKILSKEYTIDELKFDESLLPTEEVVPSGPPKALALPAFKEIKSGKVGLEQLQKSKKATDLDSKIKAGTISDQPCGPGLKDRAIEKTVAQRTDEYKNEVATSYDQALREVRFMLMSLANAQNVDGKAVRSIVERFVKTFITDKNILLNISGIKGSAKDYLFSHTLNVCLLSINIAASFGYNEEQVIEIGMGALLHDIGMLLVAESIRNKSGKLNEDEWFEVQKHPILGLHLLEGITRLPGSVPIVAYQCHERENSLGYPKQRSGRLLHSFAKIVQIADIFEALSSPRAYREPNIPYKAMESTVKMTRQGLISGEFVRSFLMYASLFPVGSYVELSNHTIGKVIKANGTSFAKPMVSIIADDKGIKLPKEKIYQEDLSKNSELQIVKAHPSDFVKGATVMDGF